MNSAIHPLQRRHLIIAGLAAGCCVIVGALASPNARASLITVPFDFQPACTAGGIGPELLGCRTINVDTSVTADPKSLWGSIECAADSRHQRRTGGADTHVRVRGTAQGDDVYRQLTSFDGDNYYGERCELGRNEHRKGEQGGAGTFALFREGQRLITYVSYRLPNSFPIRTSRWQTLLQMKQAQPSAGGGGTPALEMQLVSGRWHVYNNLSGAKLWSAPAKANVWTRFAFDVSYSRDPRKGSIRVYADLNGDRDSVDPGEQSGRIQAPTLKTEKSGGWDADGISPGESIPSHLRVGPYHHRGIDCPAGCSVHIDNVEVVEPL